MAATLNLDNPVFALFAYYAILVILKMFVVALLTSFVRLTQGIYTNPEDAKAFGAPQTKTDQTVERIRRNHLNDLENIPAFLVVGLLYVLIDPSYEAALWHFRIFVWTRIFHTISYQLQLQPWRAIFFTVGLMATTSMAIQVFRSV